jgi:hypothetical protein
MHVIHHPRWEVVYQPTYAAYLNLIGLNPPQTTGFQPQ